MFSRQDYREQACAERRCSIDAALRCSGRGAARRRLHGARDLRDLAGNATTHDVPVGFGPGPSGEHSLGLEEFWNYDAARDRGRQPAGVDTGTGNLVWHSTARQPRPRPVVPCSTSPSTQQDESTTAMRPPQPRSARASRSATRADRLDDAARPRPPVAWGGGMRPHQRRRNTSRVPRRGRTGPDLDTRSRSGSHPPGVQLRLRRWSPGDPAVEPAVARLRRHAAAASPSSSTTGRELDRRPQWQR